MELKDLLASVEMFAGLSDDKLAKLAAIFEEHTFGRDEKLFSQGDEADRLYLVRDGFVEIVVESDDHPDGRTIVNLGPGQSVGEMALVDQGPRSATVRAATDNTRVASVSHANFEALCEDDSDIGYQVMRNIAADLSFRIRHRTLDET